MNRATSGTTRQGELIAAAGGALLIISLFLEWASDDFTEVNGWELWTAFDVFFLIVGLVAITLPLLGAGYRLFRDDLSHGGAADLLGVVSTVILLILLIIDWPEGASRGIGVFLALIASGLIAFGAGDWTMFRGGARPATTAPPATPPTERPPRV